MKICIPCFLYPLLGLLLIIGIFSIFISTSPKVEIRLSKIPISIYVINDSDLFSNRSISDLNLMIDTLNSDFNDDFKFEYQNITIISDVSLREDAGNTFPFQKIGYFDSDRINLYFLSNISAGAIGIPKIHSILISDSYNGSLASVMDAYFGIARKNTTLSDDDVFVIRENMKTMFLPNQIMCSDKPNA